ncbi:MAG: creatininase family protein [Chloroflexota bacterium]
MNIKDVAWVDVKEKLGSTDLLILPLGATETYGHHLAMGTESHIADYVATELGRRLDCLVAPTIPVTWSELLDPFPGNLYAPPPVLKGYVQAICDRMVAWGIKRVFFLNVHGPNLGFLEELSREYMRQGIRCAQIDFWRFMIKQGADLLQGELPWAHGHAGEMAVAVALAIKPELVFQDRFTRWVPEPGEAGRNPDVATYRPFTEDTPTGHFGDPSRATAEEGRQLLERTLDRMERFLRDWK